MRGDSGLTYHQANAEDIENTPLYLPAYSLQLLLPVSSTILFVLPASQPLDYTNRVCKSNAAKKDVQTAVNIIRSLGIEEEVRKKALQYATKATRSLDSYSGSDKKEMVCLLDFVVKRSL